MGGTRLGIIGATGAVGEVFLTVLEERQFQISSLRLCASSRSLGKSLPFKQHMFPVELVSQALLEECDLIFISVSAELSRQIAPQAVKAGCIVIDDSSAYRMEPDVPLIVPEINPGDADHHNGILAIPNCSTTPVVMALHPLRAHSRITRLIVSTYQSVSGTGKGAVDELLNQSRQILDGQPPHTEQYPHQIAFNVLPHIETFLEDGYTKEEQKVAQESRKILHLPDLLVSATCVRVPVVTGHSASVHVEFERPLEPKDARDILKEAPGIVVLDVPLDNGYPMPINVAGRDEVFVGRIRKDASNPNGLVFWVATDNLRKGAATNAIQIAETLIQRGSLSNPPSTSP